MENRGGALVDGNDDDVDNDSLGDDKNKVRATGIVKGITGNNDFAEEFPPELSNTNMPLHPTAVPPHAALPRNNKYDLDLRDRKDKLELAPPVEPERPAAQDVSTFLENPATVMADTRDVIPGAFQVNPYGNVASTQAAAGSIYDSSRVFAVQETNREEETRNTDGPDRSTNQTSRVAESDMYAVEAQRVQDEEGEVLVAEVQYVRTSWYQRPFYRWVFVGSVVFACILLGTVVVLVVGVIRPGSADSPSSAPTRTAPVSPSPTPAPTSPLAPEEIACNFLSMTSLAECQAAVTFDSYRNSSAHSTNGTRIPTEVGLLTQLTLLDLTGNGLTGSIPSSISGLTNLNTLSFGSNQLTGTIPPSLALLTQLTFLTFFNNSLAGSAPSSFSSLTQLTSLGFDINDMSGSIPSSFSSLTLLQHFALDGNQFSGSIPTSLCSHLTSIPMDCGEIACDSSCPCTSSTGSACSSVLTPEQIACNFLSLPSLADCRATTSIVGSASINGTTIPSELGLLTQLTHLSLFSKGLTGTIPQSLALLTQLSFLSFYNNALTGTIPSTFSSLTLLTGMGFDMNQMTGSIPSSFSSLTQLQDLAVFGNEFTGSMPTSLCAQMNRLRIDCGEITCDASCPCASSTDTACP
ncbi:hypothetical protein MHU86_12375 [Fragilaria crotonensis]|nr:hypothetical protein MHU86_12375 [Fragilaria crotonensis]